MRSEWKVTSNPINGKMMYGVYRLIDPVKVDYSGNREMHGDFTEDRAKAEAVVRWLNLVDTIRLISPAISRADAEGLAQRLNDRR